MLPHQRRARHRFARICGGGNDIIAALHAPENAMNFDLHIQNIGKLTDAKIRIGRFTVFAGPNNTGKSFVSKILYSIFNAMNAEHDDETRALSEHKMNAIGESPVGFEKHIKNTDAIEFITDGMEYKIKENLIQNFQIPNLSDLMGAEKAPSRVDIKDSATFEFLNEDIKFIGHALASQLQQFSNVIYAESPAYWKLKSALEDLRVRPRYTQSGRERLSGVPEYFYDLASALRSQYTGEMAFQDVYERLTGKEVLGGKIVISDTGAFLFQENGRSFTMPVTAMGVANLGVLALLIERKVLDQETFIFIDEPEAHLHPAWQVVMAEILFELAKGGAHVVIATHSADILKWLEVHVKKHPEDEELVALNRFPVNGNETDDRDFEYRIAAIKQELTRPFADLYAAGL